MTRRILGLLAATCMTLGGLAATASADPNPGSTAGFCEPPGQFLVPLIKSFGFPPGTVLQILPPGQAVSALCTPPSGQP